MRARRPIAAALVATCALLVGVSVTRGGDDGWGGDPDPRIEAASGLEKAGRWGEAREAWLRLAADHPLDRRVLFGLERVHRRVEDDGRYFAWLRESIHRHPADGLLFRHYLTRAVREGALGDLEGDIRRHMEASRRNEAFFRGLSGHLGALNLPVAAAQVLVTGERELGDATLFARELSDLYFRTGRYRESFEEMLHALRRNPDARAFARRRAAAIAERLSPEEVLERVEGYAEGDGESAPAFLDLLARLRAEAGDIAAALSALERLAGLEPESAGEALEEFAGRFEAGGALPQAVEARRLLARLQPDRRVTHQLEIARLYRAMGRPKRARDTCRRLLEGGVAPEARDRILYALGEIELYDLHRPGEAIARFEEIDPGNGGPDLAVDAALGLAVARAYSGDMEGAAREAARAESLRPPGEREIDVAFFRAETEIAAGRIEEGRRLLAGVFRRRGHPRANDAIEMMLWLERDGSPGNAVSRGLVLHRLISPVGDVEEAIRRLEALAKEAEGTPLDVEARLELAGALRSGGRFEDAVGVLEAIVSGFPGHRLVPRAEWTIAEIHRADLGRPDRARPHLERILREFGSSAYAPRARRAIEAIEREGEPRSGAGVGRPLRAWNGGGAWAC
jgi:tetratricopeptide (TPR) repeat protein